MSTTKDKSQGMYNYLWSNPNWIVYGPSGPIYLSSEELCILECERLNAAYSAGQADRDELVKKVKALEFALGEAHCAMNYRGWSAYEKGSLEHKAFHAANRIRNPHHY